MLIETDPDAGFCFGVKNAIQIAEDELNKGNNVYCLGEMVHNEAQMQKLYDKGLKVVSISDFKNLTGEMVLLRAHGEPPSTYQLATQYNIRLMDATCPIVSKLQKKVNAAFSTQQSNIVIYGKNGHAEVVSLNGNAGNQALIIENAQDVEKINFDKPVEIFSQTTMDAAKYNEISGLIKSKALLEGNTDVLVHKSACKQVSGRAPSLRKFASEHDIILFVAGKNSSNGAYLHSVCLEVNSRSYLVNEIQDIDLQWFTQANSVGVSGATSTPEWQINEIAEYLVKHFG